MSLNQAFLDKLKKPSLQDDEVDAEVIITDAQAITEDENGQAQGELSTTTAQADTELEQLRAELASKEAEIATLKSATESDAEGDEALDQDYQTLVDSLGEDAANVIYGRQKKLSEEISELRKFKQDTEQSETSAAFIRAAGNDVLKTFNDQAFQKFAKGEKLGRISLFDELNDIVQRGDMSGVEFLAEQVAAFSNANKTMRKAQIGAGRSPLNGEKSKELYDEKKAEALKQAAYKKRYGSPERKEADAKYRKYLETTI